MKIVHLCLSCFYVDDFSYQENQLVAQNIADGHDVTVIASTESFGVKKEVVYVAPGRYVGSDGAPVIRLPYRSCLPHKLMRKIRMHAGVYSLLEELAPDVMLFHGTGGWELINAARYKKRHPNVRFFVDSHSDTNNSARGWLSRRLLHGFFYRLILNYAIKDIEKILCVNIDAIDFAHKTYKISKNKLEFYPLGGHIVSDAEYFRLRRSTREELGIEETSPVFVQSGKMDARKKIIESLRAFAELRDANARFFLAGYLHDDVADEANAFLTADSRIRLLGWLKPSELFALLCGADFYVQPGTQSATMQMSLCARCAVILDDIPSHQPYVSGNGWLVGTESSLAAALQTAGSLNRNEVKKMHENSKRIAAELLDYRILAARLYSPNAVR